MTENNDKWKMKIQIDNENVRASNYCPLCNGRKEVGLVACWPCYRSYNLRQGNPWAEEKIERANGLLMKGGQNEWIRTSQS